MRYLLLLIFAAALFMGVADGPSANTVRPGRPQPAQQAQPQKGQAAQPGQQEAQDGQKPEQARQEGQPETPDQAAGKPAESEQPAGPEQAGEPGNGQDGQARGEQPENGSQPEEAVNAQAGGEAPVSGAEAGAGTEAARASLSGQNADNGDNLSINAIGNLRPDLSGKPLVLPESSEDMAFLNGDWMFDKQLKTADGETLNWNFSSRNGVGVAVLTDSKNNSYEARMSAKLEDGVLRMRTDSFSSSTSPRVFASEYVECRNGAGGAAECRGSDGFGEWNGERIFHSASAMARETQTGGQGAAESASGESSQSAGMTELAADGPEIPAEILQKTRKATGAKGGEALGALEGHWRYSQDLARKTDGEPVTIEFHFDRNGKGYSLIRGGADGDFRADASAMKMPDGKLRVKTEEYSNGKGKGYYPTFMECKARAGQDLSCDLSNGWMHSDGGRLVDLNSYQENVNQTQIEELMPGAQESGTDSAEADSSASMEDILAGAAEEAQKASRAEQTRQAGGSGGRSESASASRSETLTLPQKGDSVAFMEGNWICKTGLASIKTNEPVIMEFSFNKNGKGSSTIFERQARQTYKASAQASFRNGVLRVNTSQFRGRNGAYNSNQIVCRNQGGIAHCTGKNGNVVWKATFVRK